MPADTCPACGRPKANERDAAQARRFVPFLLAGAATPQMWRALTSVCWAPDADACRRGREGNDATE
jgi:hypothetical protein